LPDCAKKDGTMSWHPDNGAFQPEELAALKKVFDDITGQPWFPADEQKRKSFAKYLLDTYPGTGDFEKHRTVAEASARMFFGVDEKD
jgi:hypothetical protein